MMNLSKFKVLVFKKVLKWVEKQKDMEVERMFWKVIKKLKAFPEAGKRLHGPLKGKLSMREGKIRVIYEIHKKKRVVKVLAIGFRKKVYRNV